MNPAVPRSGTVERAASLERGRSRPDPLAAALAALAAGDSAVRLPEGEVAPETAREFHRVAELLAHFQSATKELQQQQRLLREANDRLEEQTENLRRSELLLRKQQAKLRAANEELEARTIELSEKMKEVEQQKRELEDAKTAVEEKAEQLALSSRYKSDFLANMSHELRTPLNSLLILAKLLADNQPGNLAPKQIEYARTIFAAGSDLLSLINDILDLAKVESGTVTLNMGPEPFTELQEYVESNFRQVAVDKRLGFEIAIESALPDSMQTDSKRLRQILRNLLSNAFKFTERGHVRLEVGPARDGWTRGHALDQADAVVAFRVVDTGIGIAEDKQKIIFEEFQQADGTTSRQYGGTGLGLSISRELARLLGGEVRVKSALGAGSTFTLYLPLVHEWMRPSAPRTTAEGVHPAPASGPSHELAGARPADDRREIQAGDRVAVIIEIDAAHAAAQLAGVRACGFKGVIVPDVPNALGMCRDLAPNAVVIDAQRGAAAAANMLEGLARETSGVHVPVKLLAFEQSGAGCRAIEEQWVIHKPFGAESVHEALSRMRRGAGGKAGAALVATADPCERGALALQLGQQGFTVYEADGARAALHHLEARRLDAIVLGPALADGAPGEVLAALASQEPVPDTALIVAEGDAASAQSARVQVARASGYASTRDALVALRERLQEQDSELISKGDAPASEPSGAPGLAGRKALIIDDDIRNIFALTSALEHYGMRVCYAESAKQGIELLQREGDADIALIDVMMPEIDGYDAIRIIRGMPQFRALPLIAVTAKAMKGDREKCIEAGASDYLSKPVKIDQLLSLLHRWLGSGARHP